MTSYLIFDITHAADPSYQRVDQRFTDFGDFMREIELLIRDGVRIYDARSFDDGTLIVNVSCPKDMVTGGERDGIHR